MGTRHLVQVIANGKTKVAQYGQWDGYPSGQGKTVLEFLTECNLEEFKKKLENVCFIPASDVEKAWENCGDDDKLFYKRYPALGRDTGAKVLYLVYTGQAKQLFNNEAFKKDHVFCEWYYIINLDDNTLTVGGGRPKVKKYSLDNLPTVEKLIKDVKGS